LKHSLNPEYDKSLKIIATLNNNNKQPVIFENKLIKGKSVYIAANEAEFAGKPSFWKGILTMNGIEQSFITDTTFIPKSGINPSSWTVKGLLQKDLSRYYVILKRSAEGRVIHIIDRKGEKNEVRITFDASVIGNVTSASRIEADTPVILDKTNNTVSFSVICDPVATILLREN
jgi:hypothetical protein